MMTCYYTYTSLAEMKADFLKSMLPVHLNVPWPFYLRFTSPLDGKYIEEMNEFLQDYFIRQDHSYRRVKDWSLGVTQKRNADIQTFLVYSIMGQLVGVFPDSIERY